MKKTTAVRKIVESAFMSTCEEMVAAGTISGMTAEEAYNKHFSTMGFSDNPSPPTESNTSDSSTNSTVKKKRTKSAQQIWASDPVTKETIKDFCKKTMDEKSGKAIKFLKGQSDLWKQLPESVKDEFNMKATELKAAA